MNIIESKPATFTGVMLIRDKDGKPKIDDPENCPKQILDMLTDKERAELKRRNN